MLRFEDKKLDDASAFVISQRSVTLNQSSCCKYLQHLL